MEVFSYIFKDTKKSLTAITYQGIYIKINNTMYSLQRMLSLRFLYFCDIDVFRLCKILARNFFSNWTAGILPDKIPLQCSIFGPVTTTGYIGFNLKQNHKNCTFVSNVEFRHLNSNFWLQKLNPFDTDNIKHMLKF